MQKLFRLYIGDVRHIIAQHFNVSDKDVRVIDCGYDKGDGPYPGGYRMEVEVNLALVDKEEE